MGLWIDNVTQWTGKGLVDIVRLAEERVVSTIRIWHRLRLFTGHGTITWAYLSEINTDRL